MATVAANRTPLSNDINQASDHQQLISQLSYLPTGTKTPQPEKEIQLEPVSDENFKSLMKVEPNPDMKAQEDIGLLKQEMDMMRVIAKQ